MPKPQRPKTDKPLPETSLTLRIPKGLHKLLQKLAKLDGRSLNTLITRMLQQGILRYDTAPSRVPVDSVVIKGDLNEPDVWPDLRNPSR